MQASGERTRPTKVIQRQVEILQDLQWEESIAAAKMTAGFRDVDAFRAAVADGAFAQPSHLTRHRYANNFIKWFLPTASFDAPVVTAWTAFRDDAVLQDVMRWQYVTSNPLVADFIDEPFNELAPGESLDDLVDAYLVRVQGELKAKTRQRIKTNLRKLGLALLQEKTHYRVIPDVTPGAIAVLLAHLFARDPQVLSLQTLLANPWWKRLGIVDEPMLRTKLQEAAAARVIASMRKVDTLDQVTTKYALAELQAGKVKR